MVPILLHQRADEHLYNSCLFSVAWVQTVKSTKSKISVEELIKKDQKQNPEIGCTKKRIECSSFSNELYLN